MNSRGIRPNPLTGASAAAWGTDGADGVRLRIHAVPRASKTRVAGLHGEALKICVAAPPADDRANAVLLRFLADACAVPRAAVHLVSGRASRDKQIVIAGRTARDVAGRLAPDRAERA